MDPRVAAIHQRAPVADGHADSLMWNRDLNQRSEKGHVDFPRLAEAGVKIQCFTVVTRGWPFVGGMPIIAAWNRWPREARRGEWASALWQVDRMAAFCARSEGRAAIAGTRAQLDENLEQRRISAVLGVEGAHAVEGQPERVKALFDKGVRFMSLTHLSNNELGGSSFPLMGNRGLTPLGRAVGEAMAQARMSIDVAHASKKTFDDALQIANARVFCSHTGAAGAKSSWRNLDDDQLRRLADKGGIAGIIFAPVYLGGKSFDDVARHVEHAVNVMGEDGVAFGSDFDGMIPLPQGMRDVRDLPRITDALLRRGMPESRVEKVVGGNFRRFFAETLP